MSHGRVVALHLKPADGTLEPVDHLVAEGDLGFVGDRHHGDATRQTSFMDVESLNEMGYRVGDLRENVTIDAPGFRDWPVGTRFRVGEAEFEVESPCEPCAHLARRLGEDPVNFVRKMRGRRGSLAKARSSGVVRIGDPVERMNG